MLLWICRLAVLRSFVSLLSCLLSEFVRALCSFSGSGGGQGVAIGQIFRARSWYALSIVMMWSAALSILVGVVSGECVSLVRQVDAVVGRGCDGVAELVEVD